MMKKHSRIIDFPHCMWCHDTWKFPSMVKPQKSSLSFTMHFLVYRHFRNHQLTNYFSKRHNPGLPAIRKGASLLWKHRWKKHLKLQNFFNCKILHLLQFVSFTCHHVWSETSRNLQKAQKLFWQWIWTLESIWKEFKLFTRRDSLFLQKQMWLSQLTR